MKRNIKTIATTLLASLTLVGCNDLDTKPGNYYVSSEQKEDAILSNPELAKAGVVGISSTFNTFGGVYDANDGNHFDFGWPAVLMFTECMGTDMVAPNTGYNHFASSGNYNLGNNNNAVNNMSWYYAYKIINSANSVVETVGTEPEDDELKLYSAQGLANRAYAYFILAQLFQDTYVGSGDKLAVPIITNENSSEAAVNGCPRATVQEVYDQILSDLDQAIKNLENTTYSVSAIADTGSKRFISLGTAYGLRARVNLVMNKWQEAAADAAKAISTSKATPYSMTDVAKPAFNNPDDPSWMWCVYIDVNDRVVTSQIVNWASHMGSLNFGYASVGAWKMINKSLFDYINSTDVRKGWWLNGSGASANLNDSQVTYLTQQQATPYVQVKFAPYQNVIGTTTNATSVILMRVEEMYLIQAEATAMAGNPTEGKRLLEEFVKTYRDPEYVCDGTSAADIQESVWMQRRIELWGEGLAYFDLLRLNKGLDRRGGGWDSSWVYNVPAPLKPLLVPNGEMDANPLIQAQNPTWSKPTAVADN